MPRSGKTRLNACTESTSTISLCSLQRHIRDDTFRLNGIFCYKEASSQRKSTLGGNCGLHRLIWDDSLRTCIKTVFTESGSCVNSTFNKSLPRCSDPACSLAGFLSSVGVMGLRCWDCKSETCREDPASIDVAKETSCGQGQVCQVNIYQQFHKICKPMHPYLNKCYMIFAFECTTLKSIFIYILKKV